MKQNKQNQQNPRVLYVDPLTETRPNPRLNPPAPPQPTVYRKRPVKNPQKPRRSLGCLAIPLFLTLGMLALVAAYFLFPGRTTALILGIDDRAEGGVLGRSDTIILATFRPLPGKVGLLSIPRDLWVTIPGFGENRINTAHFFAEAADEGSGPEFAAQIVEDNFRVDVDHTVRLRFDNFKVLVDALGGVEVDLPRPMSGYDAGRVFLDSEQALAFVRDRQSSDDFGRMERGQIFLFGFVRTLISPQNISRVPAVLRVINQVIETDISVIWWPRLAVTLLRSGSEGTTYRTINRDHVTPWLTDGGAQVLLPNWDLILPVVDEVFGS